jgi:hypothetical protein
MFGNGKNIDGFPSLQMRNGVEKLEESKTCLEYQVTKNRTEV